MAAAAARNNGVWPPSVGPAAPGWGHTRAPAGPGPLPLVLAAGAATALAAIAQRLVRRWQTDGRVDAIVDVRGLAGARQAHYARFAVS